VALAWTALSGGGLSVAVSCGGGTEPVPTCPATCPAPDAQLDQVSPDAATEAMADGPVDVLQEFPVI